MAAKSRGSSGETSEVKRDYITCAADKKFFDVP
jgi:hypothetical protein